MHVVIGPLCQALRVLCCLKVEASTSKGVIRIAGTAAGGILAYAVMLKPALATRSVPLAAILLAVTFLSGCAGHTQFKVNLHLLCFVCCPLPSAPSALRPLPSALCLPPSALGPPPSALCLLPPAPCPLPPALCPLPCPLQPYMAVVSLEGGMVAAITVTLQSCDTAALEGQAGTGFAAMCASG